jgi:putative ABC transport system substrate-binding protein
MQRRYFISLLGGAAAWPMAARAQNRLPGSPLIGYLSLQSENPEAARIAAFKRGLSETGYVEGQNFAIEYRFSAGRFDRLPALAGELVHGNPVLIFAMGPPSVPAVRAHTRTIPIVF